MEFSFVINGSLPGLNEYLSAQRETNGKFNSGNEMKRRCEQRIIRDIRKTLNDTKIPNPVFMQTTYYESNKKRDPDNISGVAHKYILDALQKCRVIENDGWSNIRGFQDLFEVDKNNPRIEVVLREV